MISGVINKARLQTPCWVLKGSSIRGGPQAQGESLRGLKQDLPGGENRNVLPSLAVKCTSAVDRPFIAVSHRCGSLGLVQRCDWSYLPRHTLGWLGAGKINNLPRKGGEGKAPLFPHPLPITPLHVTLPAVSPSCASL